MLSDEELMLLEQLTYMTNDVNKGAGTFRGMGNSVSDILKPFDDTALSKLESGKSADCEYSGLVTGKEWAAIIRKIKSDPNLMSLKITDTNSKVAATCYEDSSGHAYVTFRGTNGPDEWKDNFEGLNTSDTKSQKEALDYIESLKYDSITVAGHSKGGNKAQYVAVLSDKVDKCVSMDGQGFSDKFIRKYSAEIETNGKKVHNYSTSNDYVHILLFPIPNSDQQFCAGSNVPGAKNHSPSSYFRYTISDDGKTVITEYSDGKIVKTGLDENSGITYLREFTYFICNVMSDEEKSQMVEYLGGLAALALGGDKSFEYEYKGKKYTKDNIVELLLSDEDCLILLVAYIMRYIETNDLSEEEINQLLAAFGLDKMLAEFEKAIIDYAKKHPVKGVLLTIVGLKGYDLLKFLYGEITDGKDDPIIQGILRWISGWVNEKFHVNVNLERIWRKTEKSYTNIQVKDKAKAVSTPKLSASKKYDYSNKSFNAFLEVINGVNSVSSSCTSGWTQYSGWDWYSKLCISKAITGVARYFTRITDINLKCKAQMENIFKKAVRIDSEKGKTISEASNYITSINTSLSNTIGRIKVVSGSGRF